MQDKGYITITSNRKKMILSVNSINYILMQGKVAEVHTSGNEVLPTRTPLSEIEKSLDNTFIKINRGCIVSAVAIRSITDKVNLNNGDSLDYTIRKKNSIIEQFNKVMNEFVETFDADEVPSTRTEYKAHYASFDNMPFAFADIEMIFDNENHAVDWIFRYGNEALARLERIPLDRLIGYSFGSIFSNMDSKWLTGYERAALLSETVEMTDYSPEIDTYLKILCFPTFKGHCGCILFDINQIEYIEISKMTPSTLQKYLEKK
jgi:hypothetical protein